MFTILNDDMMIGYSDSYWGVSSEPTPYFLQDKILYVGLSEGMKKRHIKRLKRMNIPKEDIEYIIESIDKNIEEEFEEEQCIGFLHGKELLIIEKEMDIHYVTH